jgi:diphthamide biosynthesis protein 2
LPLIKHLRELIAARQKKSYTVAVGKLNPAKLANFLEVECFVLVACPENTLIDSKEFLRPIVTPYELELALTSKSWSGDYILDFTALLSSSTFGQNHVDPALRPEGDASDVDDDNDADRPVYSSTTGKYRHPKRYTKAGVTGESAPRSQWTNRAVGLTITRYLPCYPVDEADLDKQAQALSIRDQSSAVARVLGSAAGQWLWPEHARDSVMYRHY